MTIVTGEQRRQPVTSALSGVACSRHRSGSRVAVCLAACAVRRWRARSSCRFRG
jgi:hypothetical protein